MSEPKRLYSYYAFGLTFSSEYELPELTKCESQEPDVTIREANLSSVWEKHATTDSLVYVKGDLVLFRIESLATFCIENGDQILVYPEMDGEADRIRLYLLGSCLGALLMQRNVLCLHGSAIEIDGKAYAITGRSGAGKSTLATAFKNQGYRLLTDDVIAVTFDEDNHPMIVPGYPQQKLWKMSLEKFGMEHSGYKPLFDRENKFSIPIQDFSHQPLPFAGMIELSVSADETISLQEVTGLDRIHTVMRQAFRRSFIVKGERTEWQFKESMKLVNSIPIMSLQRPHEPFTAPELVEKILDVFTMKEEVTC